MPPAGSGWPFLALFIVGGEGHGHLDSERRTESLDLQAQVAGAVFVQDPHLRVGEDVAQLRALDGVGTERDGDRGRAEHAPLPVVERRPKDGIQNLHALGLDGRRGLPPP